LDTLKIVEIILVSFSLLISFICFYYTFKTKRRYEKLALRLGNNTDISVMLKSYIDKVNEIEKKDDQIIEYCNKINDELKNYSQILASKKQIIVANKMDIANDETLINEVEELCKKQNLKLFKISAATREGIDELIEYVAQELKNIPKEDIVEVDEMYGVEDEVVDQEWFVETEQRKDGIYYIVSGAPNERLMSKVNIFDVLSF